LSPEKITLTPLVLSATSYLPIYIKGAIPFANIRSHKSGLCI